MPKHPCVPRFFACPNSQIPHVFSGKNLHVPPFSHGFPQFSLEIGFSWFSRVFPGFPCFSHHFPIVFPREFPPSGPSVLGAWRCPASRCWRCAWRRTTRRRSGSGRCRTRRRRPKASRRGGDDDGGFIHMDDVGIYAMWIFIVRMIWMMMVEV